VTRPAAAPNRRRDRQPRRHETKSKLLNSLAASPWSLFCTSFALTALLIRTNGSSLF
jgi:hypothetical protein